MKAAAFDATAVEGRQRWRHGGGGGKATMEGR